MDILKFEIPAPSLPAQATTRYATESQYDGSGPHPAEQPAQNYPQSYPGGIVPGELKALVSEIVSAALSEIKIYVSESEITGAQERVRAVMKESEF